MSISSVSDPSVALSAYSAYQQQPPAVQPGAQDSTSQPKPDPQTTEASKKAKGVQVSFTNEALRLSAQSNQQSQASNVVEQATKPQNANTYPPQSNSQVQAYQASGAQSMTQAISSYHNTFKI